MKKLVGLGISLVLIMVATEVAARAKKGDFELPATVTQGQQFSNQVDVVSLYMTSDRVAYVPKVKDDLTVVVETTVLSPKLIEDPGRLESFVSRQINAYIKVLKKRLEENAPDLARRFEPQRDLVFNINEGSQKKPVAKWQEGEWQWISAAPTVSATVVAESVVTEPEEEIEEEISPPIKPGCNCPALRRSKKAPSTPISESEAADIPE